MWEGSKEVVILCAVASWRWSFGMVGRGGIALYPFDLEGISDEVDGRRSVASTLCFVEDVEEVVRHAGLDEKGVQGYTVGGLVIR